MTKSVDYAYTSPALHGADQSDAAGPPTGVRYRIVALSICMAFLLYLDRFALTPITPTIISDLGTNKEMFGWGNLIFFWAYALFQVPAGALADRFGARRMLMLYVVAWSLATIALGIVPGLIGMWVLRGLMGAAQAGAYPAAGSYLKRWVTPAGRARANSFVSAGGRVGGLAALMLTAWLAIQFRERLGISEGWRGALVVYGALGLLWSVLFWWSFRDRPSEHPGCNQGERTLIGNEPVLAAEPLPITAIVTSANVWLLSFSGFLVNVGWIFLMSWQTTYILETFPAQLQALVPHLKTPQELDAFKQVAAGWLTAVPLCGGILGGVCGGFAADVLRKNLGPIWGRRVPGLLAGTLAGSAYVTCHFVGNLWLFIGLMFLISFTIDMGLGSLWATYQDFGGKHVGSVLGFANMWGNLGAGLCGWYYGRLADQDQWPVVFTISTVALFLMSASWLLVDPTRKLVPGDET
jgi:MFS family permease